MARAQQAAMPRVGFVSIVARDGVDVGETGLRQGLADRGYVVHRNLAIEERRAEGVMERIPALIDELLAIKVDVLVTPGTPITLAAKRKTSTVPIVCVTGNPVGAGIVASLSRPGGQYHRTFAALRRLQREMAATAQASGAGVAPGRGPVEPR